VLLPTLRHAARAFGQFKDLELADLLSAAVAIESCLYSALVRVPLGTAATAEDDMQMAVAAQAALSPTTSRFAFGTPPSVRHHPTDLGGSPVTLTDFLYGALRRGGAV
jgi:hypothetical protein